MTNIYRCWYIEYSPTGYSAVIMDGAMGECLSDNIFANAAKNVWHMLKLQVVITCEMLNF